MSKSCARVAIVLVNWNGWGDSVECIDSVLACGYPDYHIYLVDNDSSDQSVEHIVAWCEKPFRSPDSRDFNGASAVLYFAAVVGLMLLTLYPLRTVSRLVMEIPAYQQRAIAWHARDANIRELQASGERDLQVPFLSGEIIQDLGDRAEFRLNRCASTLYGVNSILVFPKDDN